MNNFVAGKTVSRIWSKREFQALRKALKDQGFPVDKTANGNGYELREKASGDLLLLAMNGNNGYLVRYVESLFM